MAYYKLFFNYLLPLAIFVFLRVWLPEFRYKFMNLYNH